MSQFEKGHSGNPSGRPRGIADKRTELSKLLIPHAEALINKVVELALAGDSCALRLCLERLIPRARDETVNFPLLSSDVKDMETLFKSNSAIIEAAANGALTPEQAYTMTSLLKTQGEFIVARDLVERLRAIEEVANLRKETKRL